MSNEFDNERAASEGWCLSECTASTYFPDGWTDLQKLDESGVFDSDWEALAYVCLRASSGSEFHRNTIKEWERRNFKLINGEIK
jgi:hypothetical protein